MQKKCKYVVKLFEILTIISGGLQVNIQNVLNTNKHENSNAMDKVFQVLNIFVSVSNLRNYSSHTYENT